MFESTFSQKSISLYLYMSDSTVYLCGMAATVFLTTSLVVAAVRWFHMCRPYDQHASHYYPGRPSVVMAYLSSLALLP